MRVEVVYDGAPIGQRFRGHAEGVRVKQQLQHITAPGFQSVRVPRQRGYQSRARQERRRVVAPDRRKHTHRLLST